MQASVDGYNAWGMDVSHYQGTIDWNQVRNAGISFAFVKATQGTRMVDDYLAANIKGASEAGILVGVYCFSEANTAAEGASEAKYLLGVLRDHDLLDKVNMELVLDLESAPKDGDFSAATGDAIYRAWQGAVEAAGKKAMLYTGQYFGSQHFTSALADVPLWIAKYSQSMSAPNNIAGWTSWEFWQYSSGGTVPGIAGEVDMNLFRGNYAELYDKYVPQPQPQPKAEAYALNADDANKLIQLLGEAYKLDIHSLPDGTAVDRDEIHRLANELRKASGQQPE